MKKSLSMLLALVLVFSTTGVFADSNVTVEKAKALNGIREATPKEYSHMVKDLNLKSEDVG